MMLRSKGNQQLDEEQQEETGVETGRGGPKESGEQSQWVMIAPENALKNSSEESPENQATIITLRHPKSDEGAQFLLCPDSKSIHEILSFQDTKGSWFIDNSVQQDGRLLMATVVDPLFLLLPYLLDDKNSKKHMFMQLDQIITDSDFPQCNRIVQILDHSTTCQVCDSKGNEDFKVYRYNEEKTLSWLKEKVERTADYLSTSDVSVSSGQCSTYVKSSKATEASREDSVKYAAGLISDYLHPDLSKKLFDSLGIEIENTKGKRSSDKQKVKEEPPEKKVKRSSDEPDEDYSKVISAPAKTVPVVKMTAAQKKLAKVDKSGMKSLMTFFKKK